MKKYKDYGAIIWIDTDEASGSITVDFEFAMNLHIDDILRFYNDEGERAPWIESIEIEGNVDEINTAEFQIMKKFFDADNLAIFTAQID